MEQRSMLVTGGAGGIGRAAALVLASAGARVMVTDIVDATETVDLIRESGGRASLSKPTSE